MAIVLLYPGTTGELVPLQEVLREAHEASRAARAAQIERRRKTRSPLDDTTDWPAVEDKVRALSASVTAQDGPTVARLAKEIVDAVEDHTLEPLGEYEPSPDLDGIMVQMQIVSDEDRRRHNARVAAAWSAVDRARQSGDEVAIAEALSALDAACAALVVAVVVRLDGVQGLAGSVAESMPALVLAGLLGPLYAAARHFLDLPPGKAVRCGQRQPST